MAGAVKQREHRRDGALSGWWPLIAGILVMLAGAALIIYPLAASLVVTLWIGWALVLTGLATAVAPFVSSRATVLGGQWLSVALGVLAVIAGVMLIADPIGGVVTLTAVLATFLVADGVIAILHAVTNRDRDGRVLYAISGAVSLVLGILLFAGIPEAATWVLGVYAGISLLFRGAALAAAGDAARHRVQ